VAVVASPESVGLLLTGDCRQLRRALSPVGWTVLEEVMLDAVVDGPRIVAATSVRRIATQLGLDPSTVAKALRVLRTRLVLEVERRPGSAGRFGLASYTVTGAPGIRVVPPYGETPHTADSDVDDEASSSRNSRSSKARRSQADRPAAFNLDW